MKKPIVETEYQEITAEEWKQLIAAGMNVPTKIYTFGNSMFPLLRAEGDSVTIIPLQRKLRKGDVIVFYRTDGKYVAHRVYWFDEQQVMTIGDNCEQYDRKIALSDVLGLVTYVHRGKRNIFVDTPLWRFYGRAKQWMMPGRKFFKKRIWPPFYRFVKKIKK